MLFNFVERSSAFHVKMSEDLLLEDPDSKKVGKQCQFLKIFVEEFFFIRNTFLEQNLKPVSVKTNSGQMHLTAADHVGPAVMAHVVRSAQNVLPFISEGKWQYGKPK